MNTIDWTFVLAFGSFAVVLSTSLAGMTYFIVKLITDPIRQDIAEMKPTMAKVKTGTDLQRMMDLTVATHASTCHREKIADERARRDQATRESRNEIAGAVVVFWFLIFVNILSLGIAGGLA